MQFSEAKGPWRKIPAWANYLIRIGNRWIENESGRRRIAIISMPCDSAGAGLVTLGAMRRRLGMKDANDLGCHFQRIRSLAIHGDIQTKLFNRALNGRRRGPYILDGVVDLENCSDMVWAKLLSRYERITISPEKAFNWQFEGESPVSVTQGAKLPYEYIYKNLVDGDQSIFPENLIQSDSYICLAGRVAGEIETRDILRKICFQTENNSEASLDKLLSIQKWSLGTTISRIKFYNSRNGKIDNSPTLPSIVIVDGDTAFLKVEADDRFRESDIIAVIHRIIERDRLEAIGEKLESLSQWYIADNSLIDNHSTVPPGISISILKRR